MQIVARELSELGSRSDTEGKRVATLRGWRALAKKVIPYKMDKSDVADTPQILMKINLQVDMFIYK